MYDLVLVTQLPAFYKVNLYNELARQLKIKVIFIGEFSQERTPDFISLKCDFDHVIINQGNFEERHVLPSLWKTASELRSITYKKVLCTGWNLPEFIMIFLTHPSRDLLIGLESSVMDSSLSGLKGVIKKLLLQRVGAVLASGKLHVKLLEVMNYRGRIFMTRGVGIINKPSQRVSKGGYRNRFLYLGRLAPEKNLSMVISAFKELPEHQLTIVGNGPLEGVLKALASGNVQFLKHVPNEQIADLFKDHDVLILPSSREPWGLVVEEALFYSTPVIISNTCGSAELIENGKNGFHFNPTSEHSFKEALEIFNSNTFEEMKLYLANDFITSKDQLQVEAYVRASR